MSETIRITYSADRQHYYISDDTDHVNRARSWVPVGEGDVLPFAFWKVKAGARDETVSRDDALVAKYHERDGWVLPGHAKWRELADRILRNSQMSATEAERTLKYHNRKIKALADAIVADGDWRRDDIGNYAAAVQSREPLPND